MENRNIKLFSNIVMPALAILATVGLFFLFAPQDPGKLFYTNMGITVWLEIILFGYFNAVQQRQSALSVPFLASSGITAVYYIIVAFAWLLLYLPLSTFVGFKVYVAVHVVLLFLLMLLISVMARTDNAHQAQMEQLHKQQVGLRYYTEKVRMLLSRYKREYADVAGSEPKSEAKLTELLAKMGGLPSSVLRDEMTVGRLNNIVSDLTDSIDELMDVIHADEATKLDMKLSKKVANAIEEITLIKNLTRR